MSHARSHRPCADGVQLALPGLQGTTWTSSTTWTRGTSWTRSTTWTRRATAAVAGSVTALLAFAPTAAIAATPPTGPVGQYVVRAAPGQLASLDRDLRRHSGVQSQIALIQADVVRLRASEAAQLRLDPRVASVTKDAGVRLAGRRSSEHGPTESLADVADEIGASDLWAQGITGEGVDVAVLDSGISRVPGLQGGKVLEGVDLSFDAGTTDLAHDDGYGHGTHLAGIIAGHDEATGFSGMAPGARLVNVKVADAHGACDISQVIAGIDWVVQHAHTGGRDIRVLNLSFGTDSTQDYRVDPLAYAAEQAWKAGIVVVVSAGNEGQSRGMTDPASDPYVLAVGAADTTRRQTSVASFSSRGDGIRNPDLVAPGAHLASLAAPGSYAQTTFGKTATTAEGLFKGSGTSQAAAVASGTAALLLQQNPNLTPDQVKGLLTQTAQSLEASRRAQGSGLIDVAAASSAPVLSYVQQFASSDGSGSLEQSRGSLHVGRGDMVLRGEVDVLGQSWGGQAWARQGWTGQAWAGQAWAGQAWAGQAWAGQAWAGQAWAGQAWG